MKFEHPLTIDFNGDLVNADGQTVLQLEVRCWSNHNTLQAIADRLNLFNDMQRDLGVMLGAVDHTTDVSPISLQLARSTYSASLGVSK